MRLVQQGHGRSLNAALSERRIPGRPVYQGARNVPAALFKRLQAFSEKHDISVWDPMLVKAGAPSRFQLAAEHFGWPPPDTAGRGAAEPYDPQA